MGILLSFVIVGGGMPETPDMIVAGLRQQVAYLPALVVRTHTAGRAFYTDGDRTIWIPPDYRPGEEMLRYVITHEVGHAALYALGHRGDALAALRAFVSYHGGNAAVVDDSLRHEIWAEHWSRAFIPGYDGGRYPHLVGRVPFRSPDDSRAFFVGAEAYMRSEMTRSTVEVSPMDSLDQRIVEFWQNVTEMPSTAPFTVGLFLRWAANLEAVLQRDYTRKDSA